MLVNGLAKKLYDALLTYASSLTDENKTSYISHVNKLGRLNVRETMIKDARDRCFIRSEDFDRDPWLFNCKNGVYDLKNGCFRKHDPNYLMSKMSNAFYDENAESPLFEKFLNEVTNGDGKKKRYLLSALGYALTGDASRECMFILYGAPPATARVRLWRRCHICLAEKAATPCPRSPRPLRESRTKTAVRQAAILPDLRERVF